MLSGSKDVLKGWSTWQPESLILRSWIAICWGVNLVPDHSSSPPWLRNSALIGDPPSCRGGKPQSDHAENVLDCPMALEMRCTRPDWIDVSNWFAICQWNFNISMVFYSKIGLSLFEHKILQQLSWLPQQNVCVSTTGSSNSFPAICCRFLSFHPQNE